MNSHYTPLIWLTAELVPAPKCSHLATKNALRQVALTAIIMKTFERIDLKNLSPDNLVDILHLAYISDKSVDNTIAIMYIHLSWYETSV